MDSIPATTAYMESFRLELGGGGDKWKKEKREWLFPLIDGSNTVIMDKY